jgi:hypothetical protein
MYIWWFPIYSIYSTKLEKSAYYFLFLQVYKIQGSRVRFPGTTKKKGSGSGTGSTQPCEYNWGATW